MVMVYAGSLCCVLCVSMVYIACLCYVLFTSEVANTRQSGQGRTVLSGQCPNK